MKTNSKSHPIFAYLVEQLPTVETISLEYEQTVNDTIKDRLQFVVNQFNSEYCYPQNLQRYGNKVNVFANWLMGLPSVYSVEYRNYAILEIAESMGSIDKNANEAKQSKITDNWFNFCANKFSQLCKFNKVQF